MTWGVWESESSARKESVRLHVPIIFRCSLGLVSRVLGDLTWYQLHQGEVTCRYPAFSLRGVWARNEQEARLSFVLRDMPTEDVL